MNERKAGSTEFPSPSWGGVRGGGTPDGGHLCFPPTLSLPHKGGGNDDGLGRGGWRCHHPHPSRRATAWNQATSDAGK
jgi:hypothetical protein